MKYLIFTIALLVGTNALADNCSESQSVSKEDVVYTVDSQLPKHLKGATITVKLADGRESTVPAEKFMVVPRKQATVVGQNKTVSKSLVCSKDGRKNLVIAEARKDVTEVESSESKSAGSSTVRVESKKELVPGINYFRRELFDTPIGAGVGVDSNGTVKGLIGLEF